MSSTNSKDPPKPTRGTNANQGEGDRVAARSYERKLKEFVAAGRVPAAARDAADAVSGPEKPALDAAEARGREPAKLAPASRALGVARRIAHVVRARVDKMRRGSPGRGRR